MKQKFIYPKSNINTSRYLSDGESIEEKMRRITQTKEPIEDGAPPIYQERNSGVDPACDIRTDRFDLALDAMEKAQKQEAEKIAKGNENPKTETEQKDITYITEQYD